MRNSISFSYLCIFLLAFILQSCQQDKKKPETTQPSSLFSTIDPKTIGINFENNLPYTEKLNCYLFKNFYNGGGVAIGDLNQDGLPDLFFCGNQKSNRLYLNKGNFQFQDITDQAGLNSEGAWSTGASWVDINSDGKLDLYVCRSGPPDLPGRKNQLYINQGNNSFTEMAEAYGLDVLGLSAHAVFFDFDHDGDPDLYLLSNSIRSVGGFDFRKGQRTLRDPNGANKFFRNDGNKFTDISKDAGIYGSAIGFGLGVAVGDYNRDGWQDMFVSNDFFERDYLYENNQKGGFTERIESAMPELSMGSMGADIADLNNDGYPEVFVTEMLPNDYARYKSKTQFDPWNKFALMEESGYGHQYARNVLQINQGDGTFIEAGRFAGVEATDWSWGALLADFDMDGWKDIFVANGIGKDLLDQDYLHFYSDPNVVREQITKEKDGIVSLIDKMPSNPVHNYFFQNQKTQTPSFHDISTQAGIGTPSFSNGSAYADLDNDGDLDLVVNQLNSPPGIYRNTASDQGKHWLTLTIKGKGANVFGLGAQVTIKSKSGYQFQELSPMRGFQSCTDYRLHFGLDQDDQVDSLWVKCPGEPTIVRTQIKANQILYIDLASEQGTTLPMPLAKTVTEASRFVLSAQPKLAQIVHKQSFTSDFDLEPLLLHMYSTEGPAMACGDVNGDQLDDLFIGGGPGQSGSLCIQGQDGKFVEKQIIAFSSDAASNDICALFFDADQDGDQDLYVGSGCNGTPPGHTSLGDRMYLNDGKGGLKKAPDALPGAKPFATAWVKALDMNGDKALDLIVGMRAVCGHYGSEAGIFAMINDGKGQFTPDMSRIRKKSTQNRMTTAADLGDLNGDGTPDLVVAYDWGAPTVYLSQGGQWVESSTDLGQFTGWWSAIQLADMDKDGDLDIIAGNQGQNSRFEASTAQPMRLYLGDFDQNGVEEQIFTQYFEGKEYPLAQRADLVKQMPILKKEILKSEVFAQMTANDLFQVLNKGKQTTNQTEPLTATCLSSCIFENTGNGKYKQVILPAEAQLFPISALLITDIDQDGLPDILLAGNRLHAKPEYGGNLSGYGLVLKNEGKMQFTSQSSQTSGLKLPGLARNICLVKQKQGKGIIVNRNGGSPLVFTIR